MIEDYLKYQQKVGVYGKEVKLYCKIGKNLKFTYYFGKCIHKSR